MADQDRPQTTPLCSKTKKKKDEQRDEQAGKSPGSWLGSWLLVHRLFSAEDFLVLAWRSDPISCVRAIILLGVARSAAESWNRRCGQSWGLKLQLGGVDRARPSAFGGAARRRGRPPSPAQRSQSKMLFYSYFKTLVGKEVSRCSHSSFMAQAQAINCGRSHSPLLAPPLIPYRHRSQWS